MTAPLKVPLPDGAVADALRRAGEPATVPGRRRYAGHLRDTWPVHRRQSAQLVGGWLVLTVAWVALGKLLTGPLADSVIVRFDERLAKSVVAHRTPTWDHVTLWGSFLAETITKVIVTAIVALVFLKLWRRWFDPSLPSGHTAAAAAYIAIAIVVFWHTRNRLARVVAVIVTAIVPVIVAASRIYRGMHFLSDTVAGAVLGGGAVLLTVSVLRRSPEGVPITGSSHAPARSMADPRRSSTDSVPSHDGAPIG